MLKRFLFVAVVVALAVPLGMVAVGAWGQAAPAAQAQTPTPEAKPVYNPVRSITVVGQGSVTVVPDIAQISLGIETQSETVADATAENEAKMADIIAALQQAGIAKKDIQTSNYSIYLNRPPQPLPTEGQAANETPKYTVSNMVTVKVRNLDLISDVLDAVVEAGANNVWGISFTVDKPEVPQAQARSQAFADARARAEALAELGGVELGPVMSISEIVGSMPVPVMYEKAMAQDAAAGASISPGEVEVGYQVQVVFYIEE